MVPTPTLVIPTPREVAELVYPSLGELASLLPDVPETHRFLAKVAPGGVPAHAPHLGPCLMWTSKPNSRGYGAFRTSHDSLYPGKSRTVAPHKWLDYFLHGRTPVPDGYELDHICHDPNTCDRTGFDDPHRLCVLHTARRTVADNRRRQRSVIGVNAVKSHCEGEFAPVAADGTVIGHLLTNPDGSDTANVYRPPKEPGKRKCRPCHEERRRRWAAQAKMLRARARERGMREAGQLDLLAG